MYATLGLQQHLCEHSLTTSAKEAMTAELESFLKELAPELRIGARVV